MADELLGRVEWIPTVVAVPVMIPWPQVQALAPSWWECYL